MKSFAMFLVAFTTIFLLVFTMLSRMDASLKIMTILFTIGNGLVILMVYSVLRDNYATAKTFKDWYEDNPKSAG